jgi:hypothetical protein
VCSVLSIFVLLGRPLLPFSNVLQLASTIKMKGSQHNNKALNVLYTTTRSNMISGKRVLLPL